MIARIAAAFIAVAAFCVPAAALTLEEAIHEALIPEGAPADGAVAILGRAPTGLGGDGLDIARKEYDEATGAFAVRIRLASGRILALQGKIEEGVDLPVLARQIGAGEVVTADDIAFRRVAASRVQRGALVEADRIIGFSARRRLNEGAPLRTADLQKPIVVRKGDAVTMIYRMPGIELTARGRALGDGGLGDTVQVVNVQSYKNIDAIVAGSGAVTVSPRGVAMN